ncbi:cell envelope integrity protein CreD [Sphingobacterium shayense]|uniref:cell envelope integrity protein CreD n=1 Tax=Sphingobacterium shayense TaxID=626343 RepID=UPI001553E5AA|nr:cell envelope integrity protein CreD [Sphingobacterium shayense]NQD72692.1 cell envelope integrity protein CreD [Sphingobacterium shayense]
MEHFNLPSEDPSKKGASFIERFFTSSLFKLGCTFFLVLVMLIPLSWVNELISERSDRSRSVEKEIASKWGNKQILSGPIIGIPYVVEQTIKETDNSGNEKYQTVFDTKYIFLMAKNIDIKTDVTPTYLNRGIYRSVVYNSVSTIHGEFGELDFSESDINEEDLSWKDAKVFVGVSDLKGITTNPSIQWGGKKVSFKQGTKEINLFERVLEAPIDLSNKSTHGTFKIQLDLRGSSSLSVFPTADDTQLTVNGKWAFPSFGGGFLPKKREIGVNEFNASWQVPSFNRLFPSQWSGSGKRMYTNSPEETESGVSDLVSPSTEAVSSSSMANQKDMIQVDFLETIDNYDKINRVSKYGILIVLLTFAALFFTEIIKNKPMHMIHYVLIGCAMVLFYTLLLAFSEHIGFNWSYLIASVATISLVSCFIFWVTKDLKIAYLFSAILVVFYLFIYCLMLLQDYALVAGTIGVFIILIVLMRWSAKINWFNFKT